MRRIACILASLVWLTTQAHAAPFQVTMVGPDPGHPRACLVDEQDGELPTPQAHVRILVGHQVVGEAVVYRIQGKRLTLYLTGSATPPAAGQSLTLVEVQARPAALAAHPPVQDRPTTLQYQKYKDTVLKAVALVDRLRNALPALDLNEDNEDVRKTMAAKQVECAADVDQVTDASMKAHDAATAPDLYSATLLLSIVTDADSIKSSWADYGAQAQAYVDRMHYGEKDAAQLCLQTMNSDLDALRGDFDKLKTDEVYLQEALDKNN
ncbi:MAG TPA: hypothetical protein VGO93_22465 [Candidatus Xenobia bacterium]|jgi:hypothetical protein